VKPLAGGEPAVEHPIAELGVGRIAGKCPPLLVFDLWNGHRIPFRIEVCIG
jgi:hypothetical protein